MRMDILKYERIRNLRIDHDLSQEQVAKYLHVKQNTYSQYEIGTLRYSLDIAVKLAEFYHTSVDCLVGLTDNPEPYERSKSN